MIPVNLGDHLQTLNLFPVAVVTASGNSTGVDLQSYEGEIAIVLDSLNNSGTSPTLDVKIQDSADNSTFADVSGATFTQLTTSTSVQKLSLNRNEVARYIRVVRTVGGTSPNYTMSIKGVAIKKYAD